MRDSPTRATGGVAWATVVVGSLKVGGGGAVVTGGGSVGVTVTVGLGGVLLFGGGGGVLLFGGGGGVLLFCGGGVVVVPVSPPCFCSCAIFCSTSSRFFALGEFL